MPETISYTIVVPSSTRSLKVSAHLGDRDGYHHAVQTHPLGVEYSANTGGRWHRWLVYKVGDTEYTIHDPTRYETNPLQPKRIDELQEMLDRVLQAPDMTPADKAREVGRLATRIGQLLMDPSPPAEVRSDVNPGTAQAIETLADLAAS